MASQALDDSTHFQIPNDHLSVLTSTRNEAIALADIDVSDEVQVAVQACLQGQSVPVPHFYYSAQKDSKRVRKRCNSTKIRV